LNQETVLLNASVGLQRALDRLLPAPSQRSSKALSVQSHTLAAAKAIRGFVLRPRPDGWGTRERRSQGAQRAVAVRPAVVSRPLVATRYGSVAARSAYAGGTIVTTARSFERPSLISRFGADRIVPSVAVAIVLVATAISSAPSLGATGPAGPIGGPTGDGPAARLAAGGAVSRSGPQGGVDQRGSDAFGALDPREQIGPTSDSVSDGAVPGTGTILDDGTILKPVAVDTTVADGKGLMRSYRVRAGDTLTGIARKHGVSMMTVWWANNLTSKSDLNVGQTLTIPPVSGVVVTVGPTDNLDTLAARYRVKPAEIVDANKLADPNLVIGQTLTIPGALGSSIATPKPAPVAPRPKATSGGSSRGGSTKPPAKYTGGAFGWPVAGGYISQYYHYGHYAIDIAADRGATVKAAAAGVVTFAGWKSNGGGYQVWISHGSGLYTTYNHMSGVSVGRGQSVSRGQRVGRVGSSGNATGPHLHFEVWKGPVWDGGSRVNPLAYL
jgi:murein DD-endopeptidase MepM/ murein hydrolase activator NlpD